MASIPYYLTLRATTLEAPLTWAISAGSLPAGLTLDTSTGLISGAPSGSGTFNFTVQVTDANAVTASLALTLVIYPKSSYADFVGCGNALGFDAPTGLNISANDTHYVAVADFNNDGKQDLAVTSFDGNHPDTLFIFLGDGHGGFGPASSMNAGQFVQGVAVGDFNQDGKQDLAVALEDGNPNTLGVLLGDGTGGFGPLTRFYTGGTARTVAVGDFNSDGKPDIALDSLGTASVSVLLGDGSGAFGSPANYFVGPGPHYVLISDFNGDGKQDLAAAVRYANQVAVLLGDGNGNFGPATSFSVGTDPISLAAGDFNEDGKQDLVVGNLYSNDISLLIGDGAGGFGAATLLKSGTQPISIAVGDFNGNGTLDLAVANLNNQGTISVLLGDGHGNFTVPTRLPVSGQPWFVAASDFNGDGRQDLALANTKAAVLLNYPRSICITPSLPDAIVGQAYSQAIRVAGSTLPLAWRITQGSLPGGLTLNMATGLVSGTPTITGTSNFTVVVAESSLTTVSQALSISVNPPPPPPPGFTPSGTDVTVVTGTTTLTFDNVSTAGITTLTAIDPATLGDAPGGFAVSELFGYQIATTAGFSGPVTIGFAVPGPISQSDFNSLSILHNDNGVLVDVTATSPPRDYATLRVYATTTSFSPFYLVRRNPHIAPMFEQTKAHKIGSTVPIKLQLRSATNVNVSSPGTVVSARSLRLIAGATSAPVIDSGNANPDNNFRYDASPGGSGGGYIFNLSTKSLSPGVYVMSLYAGNNHSFFYTVKFELK